MNRATVLPFGKFVSSRLGVIFAALIFLTAPDLYADAPPTTLNIRYTGTDFEGRQTFQLEWNAVSNVTYLIQSGNFGGSNGNDLIWKTTDAITPTDSLGNVTLRITPRDQFGNPRSTEFFRLVLPQPEILSVEPAVLAPGVAMDLYIVGQCLGSNDVLRVNGVPQTNIVFLNPTLLSRPSFTPDVAGTYVFELVVGGVVRSSFTVTCADPFANPDLVLQGPPEEPASPTAFWLSKKGYDRYMAKSDMASAGAHNNPYFKHNNNSGDMPEARLQAYLSKKGYDYYQAQSELGASRGATRQLSEVRDCPPPSCMPFSGEVRQQIVDLAVEGRGLDFIWARTYRSRQTQSSSFGERWTHSYDVHVQPLGGDIVLHDGTGRADTFFLRTNGTYTCPEFFREGTLTGGVFRLTFADTGYWEFNPLDGSATDGKLSRIVDRNGNTVSLNYDGSGLLSKIVDDLDRTNTVAYDLAGRVASVTDFSGRVARYEYDGNGDLVACVSPVVTGTPNGNDFPGGKTNRYTYSTGYLDDRENHLLLSVIDADGQTTQQHVYQHNQTDLEFLRCIALQRWTNTPAVLSYLPQTPTPANHFAVLRCVMNDPQGNVTEEFYDARNRCVTAREFNGRATSGVPVTDTVNRPTGKLRASDPDYYETRWAWNNDSLCTGLVFDNHQIQCIYESDFDKSTRARKRADRRVLRELPAGAGADTDGDGVEDLTERVWRFEYDPAFGSSGDRYLLGLREYDPTKQYLIGDTMVYDGTGWGKVDNTDSVTSNVRTRVNQLENVLKNLGLLDVHARKGWDGTIKGRFDAEGAMLKALPRTEVVKKLWADFVISSTDPRGHLTTGAYDPNGNLTNLSRYKTKDGAIISADFDYKAHGKLGAVTNAPDANGYRSVDTFSYYTSGPQAGYLQQCVMDANGLALTTTFEYDARGNLTRCVDPRTNDWLFTYNSLDQLVQSSSATLSLCFCRIEWHYSYDAKDNLVQRATDLRDETGTLQGSRTDTFHYDALHRLTEVALAVDATHALTNRFVHDGNDQCILSLGGDAVSGTDPHQAVAYQYDERGLLFREIGTGSGNSPTNEFDYNPNGQTSRVNKMDALVIKQKTFAYDGFDRLSNITDPMGDQTVCFYDANNNLKVVRELGELNDVQGANGNVRLAETIYECDDEDRHVARHVLHFNPATQSPIGDGESITRFVYAPNGECITLTDDLGRATTFAYDTAGRAASVSSPGGKSVTACVRDAAGNVTAVTRTEQPDLGGPPQVFSWTNVYDSLNRCVSTTDNVGNTNRYAYDSLDRCVHTIDPRGIHAFYSYDLLDRRTAAIGDLDGDGVADVAHDISSLSVWSSSSDQLLASIDSHGNTTTYAYDSLSRCTQVTQADGTHRSLVWSPQSNLMQETDANGTVVVHTYDLNDRCISNSMTPGSGVASTTTFEAFAYDGSSRLVAATNDVSHSELDHDSLGNCVGNHTDGWNLLSAYDSVGNRLSLTYPGGRTLAYAYDVLDQCTNIMETGASLASFSYAGPGRIARASYGNGTRTQVTYDGLAGTPNAAEDFGHGQVSSVTHAVAGGSPLLAAVHLKWDRNGNKTLRTDTIFAPAIPRTNDLGLTYDAADRLTRATLLSGPALLRDTLYGLDLMGNRTNVIGAVCSGSYTMNSTVPPADFQMNQYTTAPCDSRSYDENGNLVSRGSATGPVTYQYDCADRLVQVQAVDFSSGSVVITTSIYAYDALGRRVSKTISSGGLPPVTTQFIHDGDGVIETRESGALIDSYVDRLDDYNLLGLRHAGQDYYFHTDDQGNVLALSTTGGAVVERYDYDDYGAVTFLTSDGVATSATSSAVGNVYCWGGLRLDAETRLHNDDGGGYLETQTGRAVRGKVKIVRDTGNGRAFAGNNPWSGGSPSAMEKGKVKFFNDAKGFGRVAGSGGGGGGGGGVFAIETRDTLKTYFETGDVPTQSQRKLPRNILKSFFETGDKPTQAQFGTLIDSTINKITDRYLLGLSDSGRSYGGVCPGGTRVWPLPGYWSASGAVSKERPWLTGHVTLIK